MGYLKCVLSFLYLLLLKPSISSEFMRGRNSNTWFLDNVRVKRQEGYNYDRPRVSFDLPTRQSTIATQAPSTGTDRIQSQFMYYAYPAPSSGGGSNAAGGGGTVNIGYSSSSTTTASSVSPATAAAPSTAANVGGSSPTPGVTGYNYGTQSLATDGSQAGACTSGYNCIGFSSTSGPTQGVVSTNAPKYLPPLAGGGAATADAGVSINVSSGLDSTSPSPTQAGPTAALSVDGSYLPPSPPPTPRPTTGPTLGPPSSTTPAGYLPPISIPGSSSNTVSTPASTYLPPMF